MSQCWRTTTWPWASNCCRKTTATSSKISPRSRGKRSGGWLSTWWGETLLCEAASDVLTTLLLPPWIISYIISLMSFTLQGTGNRHVQTHEPAGWSEDDGWNQEGDKLWSAAIRQLHRQDAGTRHACTNTWCRQSGTHERDARELHL